MPSSSSQVTAAVGGADAALGVPGQAPTAGSEEQVVSSSPLASDSSILFTLNDSMISEAMDHYLVSTHRNDCTIDLSSDEEVEKFIDEATWSTRLAKFKSSIYENTIAGAVISHTGLQKVMDHEKRLKQVRLSSALLIRLVSVLELLLDHGVPFVFIVPWPEDSREDIRTSPRAVRLKDLPSHHFIMVGIVLIRQLLHLQI